MVRTLALIKVRFYENYCEAGVIYIQDLLFDLNVNDALGHWLDKMRKIKYAIPSLLKNTIFCSSTALPFFSIDGNILNVEKKKEIRRLLLISCSQNGTFS